MNSPDHRSHNLLKDMRWSVLFFLLIASCSKPAPDQEKTLPTPIPFETKDKSVVSSQATPIATPVLRKEDIGAYASSLGVDEAIAQKIWETEIALWPRLRKALEAGDVAALSNMMRSHVENLQQHWAAKNTYLPDVEGKIPTWFNDQITRTGRDTIPVIMNRAGYLGLASAQLIDQRIAYATFSQVVQARPDFITDIIAYRLDAAPSPVDAILYEASIAGFAERTATDGRTGTNDPDEDLLGSDAIKQMASAKNPIYRLIAVEQARRINTLDRLSLYESFVTEKDPRITRAAIEGLAQMQSDKTIELLRRFQQASIQAGQKDNADLAAKAITNQP